jgi:hypothetical protein
LGEKYLQKTEDGKPRRSVLQYLAAQQKMKEAAKGQGTEST